MQLFLGAGAISDRAPVSPATLCSVIKKLMLGKLSPLHAGFKLVPGLRTARVSGSCKPLPFWCPWAAWSLGLLPSAQDFGRGFFGCCRRWAYHRVGYGRVAGQAALRTGSCQSLLQQQGDLKESTPTTVRVVECGKQAGKEETSQPMNTHLHSKFYCLQSSIHPQMQHCGCCSVLEPGAA